MFDLIIQLLETFVNKIIRYSHINTYIRLNDLICLLHPFLEWNACNIDWTVTENNEECRIITENIE